MRGIETNPERHRAIMAQFGALKLDCAENLWRVLERYANGLDPDLEDLCGWLNGAICVYAANVPGCPVRCLVSIDQDVPAAPVLWHGLSETGQPCAEARHLAALDRGMSHPRWEPRDEE